MVVMRLQPDLGDLDEPLPSVTASFSLVDVVADEPLAFDRRWLRSIDLVNQKIQVTRPKADQARERQISGPLLALLAPMAP